MTIRSSLVAAALALGCAEVKPLPPPEPMSFSEAALLPLRFPDISAGQVSDSQHCYDVAQTFLQDLRKELEYALSQAGFKLLGAEAAHSALDISVRVDHEKYSPRNEPIKHGGDGSTHLETSVGDETGVLAEFTDSCKAGCDTPGNNARAIAAKIARELASDPALKALAQKEAQPGRGPAR